MRRVISSLVVGAMSIWMATTVSAEEPALEAETEADREAHFNVVPIVGYTPETGAAGAGLAIGTFYADDTSTRRSVANANVALTTRDQFRAGGGAAMFMDHDRIFLKLNLTYLHWSNEYFGVGTNARSTAEDYLYQSILSEPELSFQLIPNVYAGVVADYAYRKYELEADSLLVKDSLTGTTDGHYTGLGGVLRYDSRDRQMATRTGVFAEVKMLHFAEALGNETAFQKAQIDLRGFTTPFAGVTLGGRAYYAAAVGAAPFWHLPTTGGANNGRGNFTGRFTDRRLVLSQVDIRSPSYWGFSAVGFASAAFLAKSDGDLVDATPRFTQGVGVRYFLQEDAGVALRVDVGFGEDGHNLYVSIGEAF